MNKKNKGNGVNNITAAVGGAIVGATATAIINRNQIRLYTKEEANFTKDIANKCNTCKHSQIKINKGGGACNIVENVEIEDLLLNGCYFHVNTE